MCFRTTEDSLKAAFEKKAVRPGDVTKVSIVFDHLGMHMGYGWIHFRDHIATMAGLVMNGEIVDGRKLRVYHKNLSKTSYANVSKTISPPSPGKEYTLF